LPSPVLVDYFRKMECRNLTGSVGPDGRGVERARFVARKMDAARPIVDKRANGSKTTEVMNVSEM